MVFTYSHFYYFWVKNLSLSITKFTSLTWPSNQLPSCVLKVPLGQIWSAWECYHCIGLEKDINCYRFFIFYFWSWIFDKSSKLRSISCKSESNLLLVWISVCKWSNRDLFHQTVLQKCSLDYSSWVTNSNIPQSKPKQSSILAYFFTNKSVSANRKTGFYGNRDPSKQEVGFIFECSGSGLWSLFKYSRMKIKNKKPVVVKILFKAYPMVTLSFRSYLAEQYL